MANLRVGSDAQNVDSTVPVEALLLDGTLLVRVLKLTLYGLHEERRRVQGTPAHAEVVQRIRYLDEVLGWVKEQPQELVVMGRRL